MGRIEGRSRYVTLPWSKNFWRSTNRCLANIYCRKKNKKKKVDTESLFRNIFQIQKFFVHGNVTSHFFLFSHIHNRLLSQGRDSLENHPGKGKARTPTTARSEEIEAAEHKNNNISIQIVLLYRNKVKWYSS